jgi:hypothetical protein
MVSTPDESEDAQGIAHSRVDQPLAILRQKTVTQFQYAPARLERVAFVGSCDY